MVACATCHAGPFFTDGKAHRGVVMSGDPASIPVRSVRRHHRRLRHAVAARPPPHRALFPRRQCRRPHGAQQLLLRGPRTPFLDRDIGGHGSAVARRALLDDVLPFYNTVRFNFRFTDEELADLAEYLLSL